MEEKGIITGATIHINYKNFGYKAVAHILINVEAQQAEKLAEYLQRVPEVYASYSREVRGDIDVIVILKTLEQLNEIKDSIKKRFSIFNMRTAIWTDVKEMNENLSIIPFDILNPLAFDNEKLRQSNSNSFTLDVIDQKIADILAENGRIPMGRLCKQIGISNKAAKRRYENLKKKGALKVTIQINPNKIGYQALCIFFTSISKESPHVIIGKLCRIPNIISVMKTTGDYDLQIYAMIQNIEQLLHIQENIGKISGIIKIEPEILRLGKKWDKWPSPRQYISTF
jgi:Lrp/AsnC family transcriptional regulator for asnA, asnC and gidA